ADAAARRLRQEGRPRSAGARYLPQPVSQGGSSPGAEVSIGYPRLAAAIATALGADPLPEPAMSHFHYAGGTLHAEGVPLDRLAGEVGTPFYCYSSAVLSERYHAFTRSFDGRRAMICYSLKANSN